MTTSPPCMEDAEPEDTLADDLAASLAALAASECCPQCDSASRTVRRFLGSMHNLTDDRGNCTHPWHGECHHPEVRPDHHERAGAWVCVLCGAEFVLREALDQAVEAHSRSVAAEAALRDELDDCDRKGTTLHLTWEALAHENEAQRECIDRLRSGWHPWNLATGVIGPPTHWYKQSIRGWEGEPEPMTPEQAAVMAR